jgi:hypothetical protein
MATPTEKTPQPVMIVERRPILSASQPEKRAPKKVPADRMETMSDLSLVEVRRP